MVKSPYRTNFNLLFEGKLYHHSHFEIAKVRSCRQKSEWKPKGLWYSCGSAWKRWCDAEDFPIATNFIYELELDYNNILVLSGEEDLDKFTRQYSTMRKDAPFHRFESGLVNWPKVSKKFYGIEINPYVWERRLQYMWYYGWDVASGCIWNSKAIKELKLIHQNAT